jgi:nicotinamide mononucleotide transporter
MDSFTSELGNWSPIQVIAVVLGIAYVVLATREVIWCWLCGIVSTALLFWIFLGEDLYQQALLQIFYIGMGFYGWYQWRRGGEQGTPLRVSTWKLARHVGAVALVLALTALTGALEARFTSSASPYLDAFTTWGSVAATFLMARKVLENWLYWFVVDILIVVLTIQTGLPATSVLYVVYVGMAIMGFISWRRSQLRQSAASAG